MKKNASDIDKMSDIEESKSSAGELASFSSESFATEVAPKDMLHYKMLRIKPEAEHQFPELIDKDLTLANLSDKEKPSVEYLTLYASTITAVRNILVKKEKFVVVDETNTPKRNDDGTYAIKEMTVFDEDFKPIFEILLSEMKTPLVATRAMGAYREAILDKTVGISKSMKKNVDEANKGIMGLGQG